MPTAKLTEAIKTYIKKRADTKLEKISNELKSQQKKYQWSDAEFEQALNEQKTLINEEYHPNAWLSKAATRAKQIKVVTHALKFTHSAAKSSGALINKERIKVTIYLTTASINKVHVDVIGNAGALDVTGLLLISEDGLSLLDYLFNNDISPFIPLANDTAQAAEWLTGFNEALIDTDINTHTLAKQLYFPVNDTYHLIAPLHATSMAHELYTRITNQRFSEDSVAARKAKDDGKYSEHPVIDFPNLAVQHFGGKSAKGQGNISYWNIKRQGKTYLLSCQPPTWKNQLKPPQKYNNQFFKQFSHTVMDNVKELKNLLIAPNIIEKNNMYIRNKRARLVGVIVDSFMIYSLQIRQLKQYAGWSKTCKLPIAQQLWLDPYRDDYDFQEERVRNNWQNTIADNFATWLNKQLNTNILKMDDKTHNEWQKLLKHELGMLKDDIEVLCI